MSSTQIPKTAAPTTASTVTTTTTIKEEVAYRHKHDFHGLDVDVGPSNLIIPLVISVIALILTLLVFLKKRKPKNNVIIVGLSDSGKTVIFSKLVSQGSEWECYKSMAENRTQIADVDGKPLNLVDFPGAERLRTNLFEGLLGKDVGQTRRVMFVVDSDTFTKRARDIAELLHDVLLHLGRQTPVLVACNKQDLDTAKSSRAIKNLLEKELALVCQTRNRTLESTSAEQKLRSLSADGEFSWAKKAENVEFRDVSALEDESIDAIRTWITAS